MLELSVRGVRVRVTFCFLTVLAVLCLCGKNLSQFALACAVHELAHLLCMALCGMRLAEIRFVGGGILLVPQRTRLLSAGRELAVLLSGPLSNLLLCFCFWQSGYPGAAAVQGLVGAWNLLPSASLDGGAALRCLAELLTRGRGADRLLSVGGGTFLLALGAICLKIGVFAWLWIVFFCLGAAELANPARM